MARLSHVPTTIICLVSHSVLLSLSDTKVNLITFPLNVTSLKLSLYDRLKHPLPGLREKLGEVIEFAKNGTITCVEEGGECVAGESTCCQDPEYDTDCIPEESDTDVYKCKRLKSSEEAAKLRLDQLQYGDSKGMMNSHPWTDSWEFQSRSEMKREEDEAEEELLWKKTMHEDNSDNVWEKMYNNVKISGKNFWQDLKKLKKLREIKNNFINKLKNQDQTKDVSSKDEAITQSIYPKDSAVVTIEPGSTGHKKENSDSWFYQKATSEPIQDSNSEESIIQFSDEKPKQDKKVEFRIDDIIKDAATLLSKKLKEKISEEKRKPIALSVMEDSNDIINSEEKLKKEIKELKLLNDKNKENNKKLNRDDSTNTDLIRKHVAAILEEERKWDKLKKLEELTKLEESKKLSH